MPAFLLGYQDVCFRCIGYYSTAESYIARSLHVIVVMTHKLHSGPVLLAVDLPSHHLNTLPSAHSYFLPPSSIGASQAHMSSTNAWSSSFLGLSLVNV